MSRRTRQTRQTITHQRIDRHAMASLVRAIDWFDNSLQNVFASLGFRTLHRTQSLMLVHIASGIDNAPDIAREMALTRQNVHHMARGLIAAGFIERVVDAKDTGRTHYRLAEGVEPMRGIALDTLARLEHVLARRIGTDHLSALREALARDWGPEIQSHEELNNATHPTGAR